MNILKTVLISHFEVKLTQYTHNTAASLQIQYMLIINYNVPQAD